MAMQDPHDTLPSSFIMTPQTDSKPSKQVLNVLDVLRQFRDGRHTSESHWHSYKIQRKEYDDLISLVQKDESLSMFVENKLRYDYDSSTEALTLRMPTHVHETFLARVVVEILSRLRTFTDARSKEFAEKVTYDGSGRLDLQSENSDSQAIIRRDPDATFQHCDALWPGVIIEVSYSQKRKALPHLADDYILGTSGSVRVVIGLDIDDKTKKGTISMWRPGYVKDKQGQLELEATQTLCNQVFRDESGSPPLSLDTGLRLELKDFAPEDLAKGLSDSFLIESALLCRFLCEAEQKEQKMKQKRGLVHHMIPGARKRRREETETLPEEPLEDERMVGTQDSEDDSSYKSSQ